MNTSIHQTANQSVYPGKYTPLPETETLLDQLCHSIKAESAAPAVDIQEFENYFMIEMKVKNVKREDVLIYIHENMLSIGITSKSDGCTCDFFGASTENIETFTESHILLPDNTDAEFITATCSQELLNVYILKTKEPAAFSERSVIVY
jgi:HSP20 family molecular chaperone IbpA